MEDYAEYMALDYFSIIGQASSQELLERYGAQSSYNLIDYLARWQITKTPSLGEERNHSHTRNEASSCHMVGLGLRHLLLLNWPHLHAVGESSSIYVVIPRLIIIEWRVSNVHDPFIIKHTLRNIAALDSILLPFGRKEIHIQSSWHTWLSFMPA